MGKLLESMIVLSIGIGGCAGPGVDQQISSDYGESHSSALTVRQKVVLNPGDCLISLRGSGECVATTKASMCVRYTDINNNGRYDEGVDKPVYRMPRSDPPLYYCLNMKGKV